MSLIIITGKKFKSTQTFNTKIKNKKLTKSNLFWKYLFHNELCEIRSENKE